jgi:hypothetical protein
MEISIMDYIPVEILEMIFHFTLFERVPKYIKFGEKTITDGNGHKYSKFEKRLIGYDVVKVAPIKKLLSLKRVCRDWRDIVENMFFLNVSVLTQIRDNRNYKLKTYEPKPPCELIINKFIRDHNYLMVFNCFQNMKKNNCALFSWDHTAYFKYYVGKTKENKYQVVDPLTKQPVARFIREKTFPFQVAIECQKKAESDETLSTEQKENAKLIFDLFTNDYSELMSLIEQENSKKKKAKEETEKANNHIN